MDEDLIDLVDHLMAALWILDKPGRPGDFAAALSTDALGPRSVTRLCDVLSSCVRQAVALIDADKETSNE